MYSDSLLFQHHIPGYAFEEHPTVPDSQSKCVSVYFSIVCLHSRSIVLVLCAVQEGLDSWHLANPQGCLRPSPVGWRTHKGHEAMETANQLKTGRRKKVTLNSFNLKFVTWSKLMPLPFDQIRSGFSEKLLKKKKKKLSSSSSSSDLYYVLLVTGRFTRSVY